ncbi:MAG: DUF4230 domain-containing protein [Solobacterium sp.]|nr:DUF4230 domain-containing protein [Solobacterium sp.]
MRKVLWTLFKFLVIAMIGYGLYTTFFPSSQEVHTVSLEEKETIMHQTEVNVQELIVQESRTTAELLVYEQDLSLTQEISTSFLNLDLFKKSMTMTSYGTAFYTIRLNDLQKDDVIFDSDNDTITITVPHSELKTVTVYPEQTEFSDVDHHLLSFGDLKLNAEQQNLIQQELQNELETEASSQRYLTRADHSGEDALRALYRSALQEVDEGILIVIEFR